jgi:polysaccharide deacetylase family protein (PEP-CTERM system associated)
VTGYRAPSFSIGEANLWAFDCLERAGYRYSSSIYPIVTITTACRMPRALRIRCAAALLEVPVTTARFLNRNWPASGGGYFRLMPYALSRWLLRKVNRVDGQPAIFYFHPWEIDAEQPRIAGINAKTRFRHYVNLHRTEGRIRRLLADFNGRGWTRCFCRMELPDDGGEGRRIESG